jgi:hypothetical protein
LRRNDSFVDLIEVIDLEEERYTPTSLLPEDCSLFWTVCLGQNNAGVSPRGSDDHPPFGPTTLTEGWRVFDQVKAKHIHEELDGLVVVVHDQGD